MVITASQVVLKLNTESFIFILLCSLAAKHPFSSIVFLTIDAVNNIKNSDNLPVAIRDNFTLETLNYSFIKLEVYHFSIVMIAGADRDVCHFSSNKISLPIALNCNLLTFIGSDDVSVIGNPVDLNMALHRENFFGKHELKFSVLVEKLGSIVTTLRIIFPY